MCITKAFHWSCTDAECCFGVNLFLEIIKMNNFDGKTAKLDIFQQHDYGFLP